MGRNRATGDQDIMRILIVEDEPTLGQQLKSTLEQNGYAVDLSTDGEDGHFLGSTEDYDAVILDLGLPEIDGLTVLGMWRKEGRKFPVLVLTARDSWSDKVAGLDAGLGYNTFPLMDGRLVPDGLISKSPAWVNLFENVTLVQFDHRLAGEATIVLVLVLWAWARRRLPAGSRRRWSYLGASFDGCPPSLVRLASWGRATSRSRARLCRRCDAGCSRQPRSCAACAGTGAGASAVHALAPAMRRLWQCTD